MVMFIPAFVSAETAAWGKGLETSIFNAKTSAEMERIGKGVRRRYTAPRRRRRSPGRRSRRTRRPRRRPRSRRYRKRLLRKHRPARGSRTRAASRPLRRARSAAGGSDRPRETGPGNVSRTLAAWRSWPADLPRAAAFVRLPSKRSTVGRETESRIRSAMEDANDRNGMVTGATNIAAVPRPDIWGLGMSNLAPTTTAEVCVSEPTAAPTWRCCPAG